MTQWLTLNTLTSIVSVHFPVSFLSCMPTSFSVFSTSPPLFRSKDSLILILVWSHSFKLLLSYSYYSLIRF